MTGGIRTAGELKERVGRMTTAAEKTDRERLLEVQVKALADRLAMAIAIFQEQEIDRGIEGDAESATWWEERRRMLIGKDDEVLQRARDDQRRHGNFYKRALADVRTWLQRGVQAVKEKKAA